MTEFVQPKLRDSKAMITWQILYSNFLIQEPDGFCTNSKR